MKSYIQPFERLLAVRELGALSGGRSNLLLGMDDHYDIPSSNAGLAISRLAYWESLGENSYTDQVYREASSLVARNGATLSEIPLLSKQRIETKIPRSRCLRYGPHGLHEYRGKFFPQLVKALINIADVAPGSTILDPMCGSGTTLVEARAAGHRAIGFDMNPLSVFISKVKTDSLRLKPAQIIASYNSVESALAERELGSQRSRDDSDERYLSQWFAPHVLCELDAVSSVLDVLEDTATADLFRVSLSNILRRVSFQKEADLRVRREEKVVPRGETTSLFLQEALRAAKSLASYLAHGVIGAGFETLVTEGDARRFVGQEEIEPGTVDLVITSPPYATALPYLDTDRLSLSYLGLLRRSDHRTRDQEMIGNREITERLRRSQWDRYLSKAEKLPQQVQDLIERVENENSAGAVGFRRRNLGALLATYFLDMTSVLGQIAQALKPGGRAFLVVGNNRTTTPAGEIEIETSDFLLKIAEGLGFVECEQIEMEMLSSRDIFQVNQTPSEHIIAVKRQK